MSENQQTPQPPQKQEHQPGIEAEMTPQPKDRMEDWKPANKPHPAPLARRIAFNRLPVP